MFVLAALPLYNRSESFDIQVRHSSDGMVDELGQVVLLVVRVSSVDLNLEDVFNRLAGLFGELCVLKALNRDEVVVVVRRKHL